MPAIKADIKKKKEAERQKQIQYDKQRLAILLQGATQFLPPDVSKGSLIGKNNVTYRSRLKDVGACDLDELAIFASKDLCPLDFLIECVSAYIVAKAEEIRG